MAGSGVFEVTARVLPLAGSETLTDSGKSKQRKQCWTFLLIMFSVATVFNVVMRVRYYMERTKIVSLDVDRHHEMLLPPIQICFEYDRNRKTTASDKGYENINIIEFNHVNGQPQNHCTRKNFYKKTKIGFLCLLCYYGNQTQAVHSGSLQQSYFTVGARIEDKYEGKYGILKDNSVIVAVDEAKVAEKQEPPDYLRYSMENALIIEHGYYLRIRLSKSMYEFLDDCTNDGDANDELKCFMACEGKAFRESCGCDFSQSFRTDRGILSTQPPDREGECDRKTRCRVRSSRTDGRVKCVAEKSNITDKCLRLYEATVDFNCECPRPCHQRHYGFSTLLTKIKDDKSTTEFNYTAIIISVSYEDHQETIIRELYEFNDIFAYLSDLGGTLGIWAGGCFISIIQILEGAIESLFTMLYCCKIRKTTSIEAQSIKS